MSIGRWFILFSLLAGCALPADSYPPDRAVQRWQGKPVDLVVASWGEPSEVITSADGQLYRWLTSNYRQSGMAANLGPVTVLDELKAASRRCRAEFLVDSEGLVAAAEWRGYECYALP